MSPKVWVALNRRLLYILICNGFMGRSGEWVSLLRALVLDALAADKDYIVLDKPTSHAINLMGPAAKHPCPRLSAVWCARRCLCAKLQLVPSGFPATPHTQSCVCVCACVCVCVWRCVCAGVYALLPVCASPPYVCVCVCALMCDQIGVCMSGCPACVPVCVLAHLFNPFHVLLCG